MAFKSYFLWQKSNKKADRFCMKFLQPPVPVWGGTYIPYFKINAPVFCCPLFSENYLIPLVRINKMVNKDTVDYQPSSSQLTLKIHPLMLRSWGVYFSIIFLEVFLNLHIPPWLRKSFKFIVLRLLANTFVSQKIESVHFYSYPKQNFPTGLYQ